MADYVTSEELQDELEKLANDLGISVQELLQDYVLKTDYATDKAAIVARLDALDVIDDADGVETLAEKVAALNAMFTEDGDLATDVLNRIAQNATDITNETTRATGVEDGLRTDVDTANAGVSTNASAISTVSSDLSTEVSRAQDAEAAIQGQVTTNTDKLTTLNGDSTVEGSVAKAVADEAARASAELATEKSNLQTEISDGDAATLTSAKSYADDKMATEVSARESADADLQEQIDNLSSEGSDANDALQSEVDALESNIGLNADGTFSANSNTNYLADAISVRDEAKILDGKVKENADAIASEGSRAQTAEADLGTRIDGVISDTADSIQTVTDSVTANATEIAAVKADLYDTTDADGNLVKGVKTKVSDLETGLVNNQADQDAKDAATNARIDELEGSGLVKGVLCGTKAANKFRAVFGLEALDEDCGSESSDDGEAL